jgi:hypothetical protein
MLIEKDGIQMKCVCPECGGDNVGESGLGGGLLHCFGSCMRDVPRQDCQLTPVTSAAELQALQQPAY